jgi:hypothetical protein
MIMVVEIELINSFMAFLAFIVAFFIIISMALKKDIFRARFFLSGEKIVKLFLLFVISIEVFSIRELYNFLYGYSFIAELLDTLFILLLLTAMVLGYFVILPKQKII